MSTTTIDAYRVKIGNAVTDYNNRLNDIFAQVTSMRAQAVATKEMMANSTDFDAADEAEVQAFIDLLDAHCS